VHAALTPSLSTVLPPKNNAAVAPPAQENRSPADQVAQSKNGLIEYKVPEKMVAGTASQVTVKVHGSRYRPDVPADATGKRAAKEWQYMKVILLAENASEFAIVPQEDRDVHSVPVDGTSMWTWNVTPSASAKGQKLQVRVYQEYKTDEEQGIDAASYTVNVNEPSTMEIVKNLYLDDPDGWWKCWLPSGAACMALVAAFWWVLKRRDEKAGNGEGRRPSAQDFI
jgi:hypothetical protein